MWRNAMGREYGGEKGLRSQERTVNEFSEMLLEKSEENCAFSMHTSMHNLLDHWPEDEQSF